MINYKTIAIFSFYTFQIEIDQHVNILFRFIWRKLEYKLVIAC